MSSIKLLLWGLLVLAVLTASFVSAQDEEGAEATEEEAADGEATAEVTEDKEEDQAQKAADDVFVTAILPNNMDKKVPAGSIVQTLIGFENDNANSFNVEYVRGFLTSPQDSTYFAQNFSGQLYNTTVDTGVEASLLYEFRPDPNIDPRDWGLIVEVFYADADNVTYLQTAYNATISVTDPESNFDAKSLFAFLAVAGVIGFGGYMGSKVMRKGGRKGAKGAKTAADETGTSDVQWTYIHDRHLGFLKRPPSPTNSPPGSPPRSPRSPGSGPVDRKKNQ